MSRAALRAKVDSFRVLRAHGLLVSTLGSLGESLKGQRPASLLPLRRSMQEFVRLPARTRLLQLGVLSMEENQGALSPRLAGLGITVALIAKRLGFGVGQCRDMGVAASLSGIGRALSEELAFANVETCATYNVFLEGARWLVPSSGTGQPAALRLIATVEQSSAQTRRVGHPLSRLIAVADRYDLLRQPEPHGKGLNPADAMDSVLGAVDLDPLAARVLMHTIGRYPIGCPVKTTAGDSAVVVDVPLDPSHLEAPRVMIVGDESEQRVVDLAEVGERIEGIVDRGHLNVDMKDFLLA